MLPGARMPLTLARVPPLDARVQARERLKRALPPERVERVRAWRRRVRRV